MTAPPVTGIYLVTDAAACRGRSVTDVVEAAIRSGAVSWVQLREKTADTRAFLHQALALKALLTPRNIPLLINDRVDIALAAHATGVHLGQQDMPWDAARRLLGPDAVIGLSVETWEDVVAAQDMEVSYLGVSPVFPTPTKPDTKSPWGLSGLARIRAYSRHPLVAIGGLGPATAASVRQAGAHALAVVSAICSAPDPGRAARDLKEMFV